MPIISRRSQETPMSPFRKLAILAEEVKKRGTHVYHLNIGQPDIPTPPLALEKLKNSLPNIIAYAPADGLASTRAALASYYQKYGHAIEADEIMVTAGGSEALQLALYGCFEEGEEVIIAEPFYANYSGFAHIAGVRVKPVVSHIGNGFALPSLAEFEAQIGPKTKGIMLCNPSNPTGTFFPESVIRGLGDLALRYNLFLIIDEVYREFLYDGQTYFSALDLEDLHDHVVIVDSVSKRFSACGARIGMLVTRNEALREAIGRATKLRLSAPVMGQLLTEFMIEEMDAYLPAVADEYVKRRDTLFTRLSAIPGVTTYKPGGAFYCFAQLPVDNAEDFCQWLLESFNYRGATVMLSTGHAFYATPGLGLDEVRIAYILNQRDLHAAMDVLEQALLAYPGRKGQNIPT